MPHQAATPEKKGFNKVPGHTRLFRRNGTYYLRAKVPEKLRAIIGKREIQESLRTRDYRDAVKLVKPRSIRVDSQFEAARAQLAKQNGELSKPPLKLSDEELHSIIFDCFIREERKHENWMALHGSKLEPEAVEAIALDLKMDLSEDLPQDALPSYSQAKHLLQSYLSEAGQHWQIEPKSDTYLRLIDFAHRSYVESTLRQIQRLERNGIYQPTDAAFKDLTAQTPLPTVAPAKSVSLGEFLDNFEAHIKATKTAATSKAYGFPLRLLREVLGTKTRLASITKQDMDKVAETLRDTPKNMTQRYPGLSIREAIAAGERDGLPKRDKSTLANNWILIVSPFNFAKDEGLIDSNPASSKRFRASFPKSKKSTRRPFSTNELNKVFQSSIYTAKSNGGEFENRTSQPERFWIPLLGLFHGCRLNEICQLDTADIQEEGGIPLLHIHDLSETGEKNLKQLKTDESRRKVPLHPLILKAGFLEFVESRKADETCPRLFPALQFSKHSGRFGSAFSKWFARLVRTACGESTKATFHSFRHNFRDAMRNASIQDETAARLGGWKGAGGVMNFYGEGVNLPFLRDAIAKIEYLGLDLSRLIPTTDGF